MTKSRKAEVNITQATLTGQNAQNTADKATAGITNLNDPNLMSVIEKQTQRAQFTGLTSQYNVILNRAKDDNISTTDLTTAYNNLNAFMSAILTDTTKASDVNRDTYKSLTDAYNTALSNVQTALSNSFNTDISNMQSSVSVASQAASSAGIVASSAAAVGSNAADVGSQALAAGKAAGDAYDKLKISNRNLALMSAPGYVDTNSTTDILLDNDALKLSNPVWVSFDWKVTQAGNWRINQVQTNSSDLWNDIFIDSSNAPTDIVATSDTLSGHYSSLVYWYPIQAGTTQVRLHVNQTSPVGTLTINNFILSNSSKEVMWTPAETVLSNAVIGTAQIKDAAITDAKMGNISANHLTIGSIDFNKITGKNVNASNITTGTMSTDRLNVDKLSALSANLGDITAGSLKSVDIVANSFSTPNGSFTTDSNGAVVASNLTIRGVTNLVYNAALLGGSSSGIPGWGIGNNGYYSNSTLHDGVPSIGFNASTGSGAWDTFAQSKLYPLNGLTGQPYSASVWFIDYGSESTMGYQFTLAFFDANGNRLDGGFSGNTWNGNPTAQGWSYKTIDNVISPSTAVYVAIQYWAYNGTGHALFSSPMLTQTSQSTGYQPDTGNVISTSTTNGTTTGSVTISDGSVYLSSSSPDTSNLGNATLDAVNGLNLYGNAQNICFNGNISDSGTKGIKFTNYGNINATSNQLTWYIGYDNDNQTASFGIDQDGTKTIAFSRKTYINQPLYVDDIYSNYPNVLRLSNQLQNANDRTALYLDNDGSQRVWSTSVWNRTYTTSQASQMAITSQGTLGRFGSASKYKLNITHNKDLTLANRLLTVDVATWFDKAATYRVADSLSTGRKLDDPIDNVKPITGLIAEDLKTAGLDMFLATGEDGTLEGIAYDRLWITLIPKIREMNNRLNELERLVAAK